MIDIMELTYEEAEIMLQTRLAETPEIQALISSADFKKNLADIISFENLDPTLLPVIEYEILIVLAQYAPISELSDNIIESTGLSKEVVDDLIIMIESTLISPIYDDLIAYDAFWKEELTKESTSSSVATANDTPVQDQQNASNVIAIDIAKVLEPTTTKEPSLSTAPQITKVDTVLDTTPISAFGKKGALIPKADETPVLPIANKFFREKLELKTSGVVVNTDTQIPKSTPQEVTPRPLTREEVLTALAPKRTMAADIERLRQSKSEHI